MSMNTSIKAFISPDCETYQKHLKVLNACIDAGISELPKETAEYFGYKYPDRCLEEEKLEVKIDHNRYSIECVDRFEILVSDIPEGTYMLRFSNSY